MEYLKKDRKNGKACKMNVFIFVICKNGEINGCIFQENVIVYCSGKTSVRARRTKEKECFYHIE